MANLTAAAAGVDVVVPAGDDNDGFLMPSRGSRSRLIASWTPVHEEMDAAAVVAALHFCHDNGNWKLLDVENARVAAAAANAAAAAVDYHRPDEYAARRGCSCGVCVAAAAADEESPAAVYASWCVEQRTGCWLMAKSWPVVMVVVRRHQDRQMEMELRPGVARGSRPQSAATAGAATCSSMRYDVDDELEETRFACPLLGELFADQSVAVSRDAMGRMWLPLGGMPPQFLPQAAGVPPQDVPVVQGAVKTAFSFAWTIGKKSPLLLRRRIPSPQSQPAAAKEHTLEIEEEPTNGPPKGYVIIVVVVAVAVAVINRMRSCVQELDQDFVHDLPPPLEPPHAPACEVSKLNVIGSCMCFWILATEMLLNDFGAN
ncbi:hypothetical protein ACLKA6_012868 [Drosophila palustris]